MASLENLERRTAETEQLAVSLAAQVAKLEANGICSYTFSQIKFGFQAFVCQRDVLMNHL